MKGQVKRALRKVMVGQPVDESLLTLPHKTLLYCTLELIAETTYDMERNGSHPNSHLARTVLSKLGNITLNFHEEHAETGNGG